MDRFSFFFAFYGLILGLAVTELLSGFADFARKHRIRELGVQIALLALLVFIDICATWIDAWDTLRRIPLNFEGLLAPILTATFYYLAATMTFPREPADHEQLNAYYVRRKTFVAAMLFAAEVFLTFTFVDYYRENLAARPAVFWFYNVPYKLLLLGGLAAVMAAKQKRANVAALTFVLLLFTIPYWFRGAIPDWVHHRFDKADQSRSSLPRPTP